MKAPKGTPAWKANVAEGRRRAGDARRRERAHQRERLRVAPQDLLAIEAGDVDAVRPELLALVSAGADEAHALLEAQGGAERASPQRTIAAQDFGRLGAVLRGLLLRWAQTGDPELASRIATVSSARRALLGMLGLDERREEKSLEDYLREQRRNGAGATIDAEAVREPAPADESRAAPSAARDEESVGGPGLPARPASGAASAPGAGSIHPAATAATNEE